jgi:hypothetical protein
LRAEEAARHGGKDGDKAGDEGPEE